MSNSATSDHSPAQQRSEQSPVAPAAPTVTAESGRATQLKVAASRLGDFDAQESALAPVQRHGGEGAAGVHAAAAHGISGGGGALPHGNAIQKAFGAYDLSNVQAHTDAKASEGATAMGADAYATGNDIAFAGAPDLHTAAHEAAHVVQQRAGVQLSGGVGSVGDPYEQHADRVADAVVAGKDAAPVLAEMAGGGPGAPVQAKKDGTGTLGTIQQSVSTVAGKVVQRQTPTPETDTKKSATPHADAALKHVHENGIKTDSGEGEKVFSVPLSYQDYVAHIKTTFAAELAHIAELKAKQVKKAGEAEDKEAKLTLDAEELNWYRHELDNEFEHLRKELSELTVAQQRRHAAIESIKPYEGDTMEKLHEKMSALLTEYAAKLGALSDTEKAEVEAIMLACMELGGQLNPDVSSYVRVFYMDTIDNKENPRLVAVAESEGMEPAKLAEVGVKYRTWSKTFVRTELMDDKVAAEILFMRDLGGDGHQVGVTPEGLAKKLFLGAQKKAKVPEDKIIPFDKADQQQQLEVYKDMLAKAKTTNPNVNAALTAPKMKRPLGLPDDQPSPPPGG